VANELTSLSTIFTEFYYWVTVVFMFLIHVGFCVYEVGVSRRKNHMHTLMRLTIMSARKFSIASMNARKPIRVSSGNRVCRTPVAIPTRCAP
jgi:hypothetical protein